MKRALAVLAAVFLLLRPVCDVRAAESAHAAQEGAAHASLDGERHDGGSDGPCCADIEDGALAKVSQKAGTPGGPEAMLAAPVRLAVLDPGSPGTSARVPSVLSRTPASFYVRSARIRR